MTKAREMTFRAMAMLLVVAALTANVSAAAPIKVLIVDGQNNHQWAKTTPVMKKILESAGGVFTVDVATSPPRGKPMATFKPDFAKYDVVLSNYNGAEWPQETKDAFVKYVSGGGGLVIIHAADNSFGKWKEYNEMIGVGGWGGRNEKSGPMLRWREGKIVRDTSPGRGGTHGPQHAFQVVTRDAKHPITAGVPTKWMHAKDELYSKLRGPAINLSVLTTAFADKAKRGTGEHEPIMMAITYGKGRVYHDVLGHAGAQMHCAGFITMLKRGTEWAATGKVVRAAAIPPDFPTPDKVSVRKDVTKPDAGAAKAAATGTKETVELVRSGQELTSWRGNTANWAVAADTTSDPKNERLLAAKPGQGVLYNGPKGRTRNILSKLEHSDVQLHVEFMVPKGSNSGVYLMARYEIQVFDSWGVAKPKHGDCGGIYQRWGKQGGYEGRPPRVNASKAPGQWQTFDITFKAPRFDAAGKKTADAVFVKVVHNGKVVHENEKLTGPTRASTYNDEKPTGPLMLQGDHGPVAYRNIRILRPWRASRPKRQAERPRTRTTTRTTTRKTVRPQSIALVLGPSVVAPQRRHRYAPARLACPCQTCLAFARPEGPTDLSRARQGPVSIP